MCFYMCVLNQGLIYLICLLRLETLLENIDKVIFAYYGNNSSNLIKHPAAYFFHSKSPRQSKMAIVAVWSRLPFSDPSFSSSLGPFMVVLFTKLENMLQNSLYVNILLTGIVAQLACYPQPLLRSFLLNTNMVFQPSVKSLIQVHNSDENLST